MFHIFINFYTQRKIFSFNSFYHSDKNHALENIDENKIQQTFDKKVEF